MTTSLCSFYEGHVIYDPDSSATVCSSCGREHSTDFFTSSSNFQPPNPSGGPSASSYVSATGDFTYHQRKRYHAESLILDLSSRLGLSSSRSDEILALISRLTDSYGVGDWFTVLAAVVAYVVACRHSLPLSLHEAASADHRQIGRMVLRILAFLESEQLPDFDVAATLDRAIRTCPSFADLEADKKEELVAMGRFPIQCMTKWCLMTGRRPLPVVAAVTVLVAEVNGVAVDIDEISKEIYATGNTSRIRLKELKETFVKVARALLPWGKDVNLKNVVHNMPLLVRFMESRARSAKRRLVGSEGFEFNLDEYLTVFLNTNNEEDSDYFRMGCEGGVSFDDTGNAEISGEKLTNVYKNVLDRIADGRESGRFDNQGMRRRRTRRELEGDGLWKYWEGRLDLSKKLSLEQVLEKDVGYDALPPSFVSGVESRERRRLKIAAAKHRINQIMDPISATNFPSSMQEDERLLKPTVGWKRKKREVGINGIDWEDCIIELLLLHQVNEDEIEEGQYNRLLNLHAFNSLSSLSAQG